MCDIRVNLPWAKQNKNIGLGIRTCIDIFISLQDFILMVIFFFVLLLWFTEFVNFFDMHKIDWIVQKWPTIPIYMSKFYIIKCCQAFLGVISSFRSHCLYAYSYFCGLKHSEPGCFLSQLTKINFWVPVQRYESPILFMLMLLNY